MIAALGLIGWSGYRNYQLRRASASLHTPQMVLVPDNSTLAASSANFMSSRMDVRVGERRVFEPDAVVRLGQRLPSMDYLVTDPVIIVEVLSPSTQMRDFGIKLESYLLLHSVQHYLIVDAEERRIVHHRRIGADRFETAIRGDAKLTLDPPGITIERFFP